MDEYKVIRMGIKKEKYVVKYERVGGPRLRLNWLFTRVTGIHT